MVTKRILSPRSSLPRQQDNEGSMSTSDQYGKSILQRCEWAKAALPPILVINMAQIASWHLRWGNLSHLLGDSRLLSPLNRISNMLSSTNICDACLYKSLSPSCVLVSLSTIVSKPAWDNIICKSCEYCTHTHTHTHTKYLLFGLFT